MTEFLDGPAAGVTLMLRRAPVCLRVVRSPGGWDALDQIEDVAEPGEWIYVYRRIGRPGMVHIDCRPRSRSAWYVTAQYRHMPDAPEHPALRDNEAWRKWTLEHRDEMLAEANQTSEPV